MKRSLFLVFVVIILLASSLIAYSQQSAACPVAAYEGDLVQLDPEAIDPDPEIGPAGKLLWEFGPPFDDQGRWQTMKGQRGIFDFWVSVSDGELEDTEHACVELFPDNRNPVIAPLDEVFITRGENTRIDATCTDPDGDPVEINYRFDGKDVAYILYEPPGVYTLEVICTDGYGGVDVERTKLHIDMPASPPASKPEPVPSPASAPEPETVVLGGGEPQPVELALPDDGKVGKVVEHDVVEVRYPRECPPCPPVDGISADDIDVVVYGSLQDIDTTPDRSGTFVIEEAPKPAPAPAPEVVIGPEPEEEPCHEDVQRKMEISRVMGCCY